MTDLYAVARIGLAFAAIAFGGSVGLLLAETVRTFRSRLKDHVSRRRAIRIFPLYLRGEWDWRQLPKALALIAAAAFLAGSVLAVFGVGLLEVMP